MAPQDVAVCVQKQPADDVRQEDPSPGGKNKKTPHGGHCAAFDLMVEVYTAARIQGKRAAGIGSRFLRI